MKEEIVMVCHLRSGRCWWILRVFEDDTFDLLFSSNQPNDASDIRRERYDFIELEKVVTVGEIQDWIKGVLGKS